jgi:hypothetical protein
MFTQKERRTMSTRLTKAELEEAAYAITGGDLKTLTLDQLHRLMTTTQFVTDLCLNEVERRGELTWMEGAPCVPYHSDHVCWTVLTRDNNRAAWED